MKNINTVLLVIIVLILVIGGIFAFNVYQDAQDEKRLEKMREEVESGQKEIDNLEKFLETCEKLDNC